MIITTTIIITIIIPVITTTIIIITTTSSPPAPGRRPGHDGPPRAAAEHTALAERQVWVRLALHRVAGQLKVVRGADEHPVHTVGDLCACVCVCVCVCV